MNAIGVNFPYRFFIARVAAVFGIAALLLISGIMVARAQDVIDEEMVFEEDVVAADEPADAEASADEEGFFDAVGDFFGDVKDAVVDTVTDAYDAATDFLGFEDEEVVAPEETEAPAASMPVTTPAPEDVDVTAPIAAPMANPFALRVQIAAQDVAAMLRSARGSEPIRYEPRAFDIPGRGPVTLRAEQDGPLFCLVFDLSEFRVAAALETASFEAAGAKGMAEEGGINTICVGLPALSGATPLVFEAVFE